MRAMKKNAKRCLATFVAVILVGGVTFSLPTTVVADNYENSDEIPGDPRDLFEPIVILHQWYDDRFQNIYKQDW